MYRKKEWAEFVKENRIQSKMTKRQLALKADVDPSYITLIERDGFVPKPRIVLNLAVVMYLDMDLTLMKAGYAPLTWSADQIFQKMSASK